jgi:hypothetical protein
MIAVDFGHPCNHEVDSCRRQRPSLARARAMSAQPIAYSPANPLHFHRLIEIFGAGMRFLQ